MMHEALQQLVLTANTVGVATREQREQLNAAVDRVSHLAIDMCTTIEAHRKPDRSAILRMAGNIAGGMCACIAAPNCGASAGMVPDEIAAEGRQRIAEASVDIARRIMACVDGHEP